MSTSTEGAGLGSEVVGSEGRPDGPVHDLGPAPALGVDEITSELRDLRAHVSLEAQVLGLVKLNVGADVSTIVGDVVELLDRHPEIITSLTGGSETRCARWGRASTR